MAAHFDVSSQSNTRQPKAGGNLARSHQTWQEGVGYALTPALLDSAIGQNPVFGAAVQSGRLVRELETDSPATREIAALAADIQGIPIADKPAGSFSDRVLPRLLRPDLRVDRRARQSGAKPDGSAPRLPVAFPTDGGGS